MRPIFQRREKIILLLLLFTVSGFCLGRSVFRKYQAARAHSAALAFQPSACQRHLYLLDHATTKWALATGQTTTKYPTAKDLVTYLPGRSLPVCPDGASYAFGTLALATACPIHGHAVLPPAPNPHGRPVSLFETVLTKLSFGRYQINHKPTCYENLRMMDGAAQQWGLETRKPDPELIPPLEVVTYLKNAQFGLCPQGGKYYINTITNPPYCTITGHTLP